MKTQKILELEKLTNLEAVHVASHWSDLYNGFSRIGFLISSQKDIDALEAKGFNYEIKIGKIRDGSNFYEPSWNTFSDFHDAQEFLRESFWKDESLSYLSEESEIDFLKENIKDILDNLDSFEDLKNVKEDILEIFERYEDFEEGFYNCNGCLIISKKQLESEGFCGYREDVWSYAIIAVLEKEEELEEEEN